jgi:hypothetical protein
MLQFLPYAITMDKNDILCLDQNHPEWLKIHEHVEIKTLATQQQI